MTLKKFSTAILAALLSALVVAVYWQTVGFEFINLDDVGHIVINPVVNGGLTFSGIKAAFTPFSQKYWIPVTWLSYMADVSISGLDPAGFHRTNVILHGINVLLVFLLFRSATGSDWKSFFVAALWAIHPLRAESVAWVAERKDVLSGLFFLLALLAHLQYARTGKKLWQAATAVFALLGLMSKPVVVVLPVAMLLMDFWPLGRFPEGSFKEKLQGYLKLLREKIFVVAICVINTVIFLSVSLDLKGIGSTFNIDVSTQKINWKGFLGNLALAVKSYCTYLYEIVWPVGLYLRGYEYKNFVTIPFAATCLAGIAVAAFLSYKIRKEAPEVAFGWFWYLLILLPNSGIVRAGMNSLADRFTYLPHIGLLVAVVWGVERAYSRFVKDKRFLIASGGVIIAFLSVLCYSQVSLWKDDLTLFGYVDKMSGGQSAHAKKTFAIAHYNGGKYREAYDEFSQALLLDPNVTKANGYKGIVAANLGRYREAAELLRKELAMAPGDREFSTRLANILILGGDLPGAARQGLENIHRWPDDEIAWQAINYFGGEAKARAVAGR